MIDHSENNSVRVFVLAQLNFFGGACPKTLFGRFFLRCHSELLRSPRWKGVHFHGNDDDDDVVDTTKCRGGGGRDSDDDDDDDDDYDNDWIGGIIYLATAEGEVLDKR